MRHRTVWNTISLLLLGAAPLGVFAADQTHPPVAASAEKKVSAEEQRLNAALVQAAKEDDAAQVALLLKRHAQVDAATGDATTALHWAAYNDDLALVQLLLKADANPEPRTRLHELTPLHMAAENGDAALLDLLLKAGAHVDAVTSTGTTPLMIAAASGSTAEVATLLAHGAQINAREKTYGETALFFAADHNRGDVVRLLLAKGADAKISTSISKLARIRVGPDGEMLDEKKAPVPGAKANPEEKTTPAEKANSAEKANPAEHAESAKADEPKKPAAASDDKVKDAYGFTAADRRKHVFGTSEIGGLTALLIAARDGKADAVRALLDAGDDINQVSGTDHATPLVLAAINGHYDLAKLLLDRGADAKLATADGVAPLYAVIDVQWSPHTWYPQPVTSDEHISYLDLAASLIAHGADVNARIGKRLWYRVFANDETWIDVEGATPFFRAAQAGDLAAMRLLADHGADPNLATQSNDTPLMAAAGVGWAAYWTSNAPYSRLDGVKFCIDHQADVKAIDAKGYTALAGAAFRGDNDSVTYLVAHGADVSVKTKSGDTVADMANGLFEHAIPHPDTVALLERDGSVNSHNCRSNACVVPTKEDKPAASATASSAAGAATGTTSAQAKEAATTAGNKLPDAVVLESKPQ